jgi:glycosyltransferase involved in cell wall biosynthesis
MPTAPNIIYRPIRSYPGALINVLRRIGFNVPVEFLTKCRGDFAIYPNYLSYSSIFKTKNISLVHDLTHEFFPEFMSQKNQKDLKRFLPSSIENSKLIITISEQTKKDLLNIYRYSGEVLVTPIPLSLDVSKRSDIAKIRKKYGLKQKFVLFVGTLEPRKNLVALMDAFASNNELADNYSLVLCGKLDWKYEETLKKYNQLLKKGISVISTGFVDEATKNTLYENCTVFVLPSHYEGFGMPIIEAAHFGAPLALSDIPVFREVAGKNAHYFDPNNSLDIAEKILVAARLPRKKYSLPYSSISWTEIGNKVIEKIYEINEV